MGDRSAACQFRKEIKLQEQQRASLTYASEALCCNQEGKHVGGRRAATGPSGKHVLVVELLAQLNEVLFCCGQGMGGMPADGEFHEAIGLQAEMDQAVIVLGQETGGDQGAEVTLAYHLSDSLNVKHLIADAGGYAVRSKNLLGESANFAVLGGQSKGGILKQLQIHHGTIRSLMVPGGQRVVTGCNQKDVLPAQRSVREGVAGSKFIITQQGEGQIQLALRQHFLCFYVIAVKNLNVEAGELLLELRIHGGDNHGAAAGRNANGQRTFALLRNVVDLIIGFLLDGQNPFGVVDVDFTRLSQCQRLFAAEENGSTELGFQLGKLLAQRRLRHKHTLSGAGDVALLSNGNNILQQLKIQEKHHAFSENLRQDKAPPRDASGKPQTNRFCLREKWAIFANKT